MKPRSRPKIDRQVQDKKPQGAVPNDGKSPVICKEAQNLGGDPAARRWIGHDDYWIRYESRLSRLKEALGIDDEGFCEGILQQLDRLLSMEDGLYNERNFDFVLSVVRSRQPVDTFDAMLVVQMAVTQLSIMRQSEILLKPIEYELPCDVAVALHRASWDAGRMEKQRIKIDDQPARQIGERMVTRLMQTYALQLQMLANYRRAAEASKLQRVPAITLLTGRTEATKHKAQKTVAARSSQGLNGSRQPAAQFNGIPKKQVDSINVQKSNGRTSS